MDCPRLAIPFLIALLALGGCGSRADYELQSMRLLVTKGDLSGALQQAEALPAHVRQSPEVSKLLIGVRLSDLGLEIVSLPGRLEQALNTPAKMFAKLPVRPDSEGKLRALYAESQAARSSTQVLPDDLQLLCNASELFAGLTLAKGGATDGWAITRNALLEIASRESSFTENSARAAGRLLDSANKKRDQGDALADLFLGSNN